MTVFGDVDVDAAVFNAWALELQGIEAAIAETAAWIRRRRVDEHIPAFATGNQCRTLNALGRAIRCGRALLKTLDDRADVIAAEDADRRLEATKSREQILEERIERLEGALRDPPPVPAPPRDAPPLLGGKTSVGSFGPDAGTRADGIRVLGRGGGGPDVAPMVTALPRRSGVNASFDPGRDFALR